MSALSQADRELIADLAAVVGLYQPTANSHIKRKRDVLIRSHLRLSGRDTMPQPKRHRWHWFKWRFLRGDQ